MRVEIVVMRRALALLSLAAAVTGSLLGCSNKHDERDGQTSTKVAVTIASGPEQQAWARDIAKRYAPHGTFTIRESSGSELTIPSGTTTSTRSVVVVFTVSGDANRVMRKLQDEPHIESVARD